MKDSSAAEGVTGGGWTAECSSAAEERAAGHRPAAGAVWAHVVIHATSAGSPPAACDQYTASPTGALGSSADQEDKDRSTKVACWQQHQLD